MFGTGSIAWNSKQEATVALSTCKAEYMALSHTAHEAIWLREVLAGLGLKQTTIEIKRDNQWAIAVAKNPEDHTRMKHVAIHYHFVREKVQEQVVQVTYVPTSENVADILTKALPH